MKEKIKNRFFENKNHKLFLVLAVFWSIQSGAQITNHKLIWQIGVIDNSAKEFALSPGHYKDFVPEGFGGANHYYCKYT